VTHLRQLMLDELQRRIFSKHRALLHPCGGGVRQVFPSHPDQLGFESCRRRQSFPSLLTLLTLLRACELLYDLAAFSGFELFARVLHEFCEPAGQLVNTLRLPSLNCLSRNQFRAHPDCGGTRQDEIGRGLLIYPSGCNQRNLRQRSVQRGVTVQHPPRTQSTKGERLPKPV
jgi:hypothetical protein